MWRWQREEILVERVFALLRKLRDWDLTAERLQEHYHHWLIHSIFAASSEAALETCKVDLAVSTNRMSALASLTYDR